MDVGAGAEPASDFSRSVVDGHGPDEMPAVSLLASVQQPDLHLERCATTQRSRPTLVGGLGVVGVNDLPPAVISRSVGQPGELVPLAVQVVDVAVRSGGPHDLRHGVGKLAEPLLTLPKGVLGTL